MPALVAGIHADPKLQWRGEVWLAFGCRSRGPAWMAGTSPAMTGMAAQ
jgi:hypothetical protein